MKLRVPIAWSQLSHGRIKLMLAIAGVLFADVLMWMQLGFLDAMFESATFIPQRVSADLVMIHPQSQALFRMTQFSQRALHRVPAHSDVESIQAGYVGICDWRNPWTQRDRQIFVYGFEPFRVPMDVPGLAEGWGKLRNPDVCLFDKKSRIEFGDVPKALAEGREVQAELNRRKMQVVGLVEIGASFAVDGNLMTTDTNFLRTFPERKSGWIDFGLIRLKPGADIVKVQKELQATVGKEVSLLTRQEFVDFEKAYWQKNAPIGFIFTMGTAIGFLVGFVVVYQILHTDVANHLPQYATLKAIGFTDGFLWRIVLQESFILAILGYVPSVLFAFGMYKVAADATHLPLKVTAFRALLIFSMTVTMCFFSGSVAVRKLRSADPADVF